MVQLTLTENVGANREMVSVFFDAISGRRPDRPGAYMSSGVVDHDKFAHGATDVPGAAFDSLAYAWEQYGGFRVPIAVVRSIQEVRALRVSPLHHARLVTRDRKYPGTYRR